MKPISIQDVVVTIMVSDMDRAIKFYTTVLPFELKQRFGNHWADLSGPGISIGLHPTDSNIPKGDNVQIGFSVADINKAVESLKTVGVQISVKQDGQIKLAPFRDPDGNMLYLAQSGW